MRIKIILGDNSDKEVEVSVKKKHRNEFLEKIEELKNIISSKDGEEIKSTKEFMDFEDKLAIECSNLTQDEYNDLDLDQSEKVVKAIRVAVFPHAGGDPSLFFQN